MRPIDPACLGWHLLDPRGRCDRHGFLVLAIALIVTQLVLMGGLWLVGQPTDGLAFWVFNLPILWVGSMAAVKRMHDIGRCGWLILAAFAFWFVASFAFALIVTMIVGPAAMLAAEATKSAAWWVMFAAIVVPAFGGLVWLHATPGEPTANRFGPVPDETGFTRSPTATGAHPAMAPDRIAHA
jgi:uncharacterized membrane protein YhaH (DUF805 family)